MYKRIGEPFYATRKSDSKGTQHAVKPIKERNLCRGCFFLLRPIQCSMYECRGEYRADGQSVIFVQTKELVPKQIKNILLWHKK